MITNVVLERHEIASLKEGNSIKISVAGSAPILLSFEIVPIGRPKSQQVVQNESEKQVKKPGKKELVLLSLKTNGNQNGKELMISTHLDKSSLYSTTYLLKKDGKIKKVNNSFALVNGYVGGRGGQINDR